MDSGQLVWGFQWPVPIFREQVTDICTLNMLCPFQPCAHFRDMEASRTPLSEAEFEEIMNRNRAISSSAISRAVSDASAGNFHIYTHAST